MATPATVARKPVNNRSKLGGLETMECKGKSKFFVEHQAMRPCGRRRGTKAMNPVCTTGGLRCRSPCRKAKPALVEISPVCAR
ncbi:hypothetical protein PR202_ga00067 [Eleusine coracana subsp. coracana]|uniref:Uncharacterized protein n=1 Tax=Eleusine coracana subsp. coracana TaxID=191504 RepID=A0AAV5BAU5_ELECO|nr:hypothetical protein PR202_ga00067 [Eleusine coracana subsp. coracana]